MNIRKLLYIPTTKQTIALRDEVKMIMGRCETIANQESKEQKDYQRTHDSSCPRCRAKQDKIIDRIASVEGEVRVTGELIFGFGKFGGYGNVETKGVNHCNTCGHEWKKFKTKYISQTDIVRVALRYLGNIIDEPSLNENMVWKGEAVQVFNGCSAEAIQCLYNNNKFLLRKRTNTYISLRQLRRTYFSIFDKTKK